MQVALNEGGALRSEFAGFVGVSDQCAYVEAPLQQARAKDGTDKSGGAGNGDQAAAWNQAEATLRRTSSAAALSCSISLALMKSRRALARDSLPDDVRGSERLGTSCT